MNKNHIDYYRPAYPCATEVVSKRQIAFLNRRKTVVHITIANAFDFNLPRPFPIFGKKEYLRHSIIYRQTA
jgi:hypothetical protein